MTIKAVGLFESSATADAQMFDSTFGSGVYNFLDIAREL
jgi:hypothetical protein